MNNVALTRKNGEYAVKIKPIIESVLYFAIGFIVFHFFLGLGISAGKQAAAALFLLVAIQALPRK